MGKGLSPIDGAAYEEQMGIKLATAMDVWRDATLQAKCDAIEQALVEVGSNCRANLSIDGKAAQRTGEGLISQRKGADGITEACE